MNARRSRRRQEAVSQPAGMSRRHFLRGLGVALAIPAMESLWPRGAWAAPVAEAGRLGVTATGAPLRMAFVYFPNGALQSTWWPKEEGATTYEFNRTMRPLERLKPHVQVLGGLDYEGGNPGGDGAGDHARASGGFLAGVRVRKTAGADITSGVTIDQVVARQVGPATRFPSLQLSCDYQRRTGSCDSGYSCAYQYNLSWSSPTTPIPSENNPRLAFERLFGSGVHGERSANLRLRQEEQGSLLDFVLEDARAMQERLGARDRQRLDEFLTSLREIERRIQSAGRFGDTPDPKVETPRGIPSSFSEHIQLMFSVLLLAFQTDSTRIATFLFVNEGSNDPIPELGFPEGHHICTHHMRKPELMEKTAKVDEFYMRQFTSFLEKLEQAKDVDGQSILHNSMIMYGCGIADGNRHTHTNLPIILAGAGGGTLRPGRFVKHPSQPITNLYLSLADRMGVRALERFGDSTGRVDV
jgi:hypothetical protein